MKAIEQTHAVPPEELMAYLDGELPPDRSAAVHIHVTQCATCQTRSAELRQVSHDLMLWHLEDAPSSLRVPLDEVSPTRTARWRFAWLRPSMAAWAFGAGAVALIVVASTAWFGLVPPVRSKLIVFNDPVAVSEGAEPAEPTYELSGASRGRVAGSAPVRQELGRAVVPARTPLIVRTVNLTIVTNDFDAARPAIDQLLRNVNGFIGQIQASDAGTRAFRATLRVPAPRLDEAVRSLKTLGHVLDEAQSGDDVTEQVRDLEVRLGNSRNTEKRLTDVLNNRTGRLTDVLEVEREIARVREEIERMNAERLNLERRVTYATVSLQVTEQRQATLNIGPLPIGTRLRNALVDGLRDAYESGLDVVVWSLRVLPILLLWTAVLWWPARVLLRTLRARAASAQ